MFLVWYSTVWGAGLITDSFQYAATARNLAHGNGFSLPYGDGELVPMTKYAPMFSILLAVFELAGVSAILGARIVNIVLFGINIFLVFLSVKKLTRSATFSLLTSLLFTVSFVTVEVHTWALSEPLYICLSLLSFLFLQDFFDQAKNTWLIYASLSASLAFLTRYVGFSLVISILIILFINRVSIQQRLKDVLVFGLIMIAPTALWTIRGYVLTQTLNDRLLGFYPLTAKNYASAIDVVYGWFFPASFVPEKWLLVLSVVILVGVVLFLRKTFESIVRDFNAHKKILLLHAIYIVLYGVMIIASKTWIDPDIGLSDRILSPMFVSILILLAVGFSFLWNSLEKTRPLVILFSLGLIAYYSMGTLTFVQLSHTGGIGIARRGWTRSETIQSLHTYSSYSIYTNSNSSLYLWSDRAGYGIPEFEALKQTGTNKRVLLVIFHQVPPTGKRLDALISGLQLLKEDQIVSVYALNPKQ
jgi:4-amino-4-deoxy-L-arabinose transferase-like glycosyltransferase